MHNMVAQQDLLPQYQLCLVLLPLKKACCCVHCCYDSPTCVSVEGRPLQILRHGAGSAVACQPVIRLCCAAAITAAVAVVGVTQHQLSTLEGAGQAHNQGAKVVWVCVEECAEGACADEQIQLGRKHSALKQRSVRTDRSKRSATLLCVAPVGV